MTKMKKLRYVVCFFSFVIMMTAGVLLTKANDVIGNSPDPAVTHKPFGNIGKELRILKTDEETELYKRQGAGCLTHMWFGGSWPDYGKTQLRIYVDDEETASIDMELMMGHGIGFQDPAAPWGVARIGVTGNPSGLYNTYRIPFGKSIRVTAQMAQGVKGQPYFWWIIRGSENLPVELGGVRLPESARLRLYKHIDYKAKRLEEFDLINTSKSGALYQVTLAAQGSNFSYLEACVRAYINDAKKPLWLSSGLEDYFLGTYYFNRGKYYTPVAGLTHLDKENFSFSAYRFHEDDPLFFENGLRLTCRCGEKIGDKVFHDPQETVYTSYVWVYEW
jgi:D-arabinan exo alpha-(1,3)/(1,5)-arabinofuranosidase (non-reducing end)